MMSNDPADLKLTAEIRQMVVGDASPFDDGQERQDYHCRRRGDPARSCRDRERESRHRKSRQAGWRKKRSRIKLEIKKSEKLRITRRMAKSIVRIANSSDRCEDTVDDLQSAVSSVKRISRC